MENLLVILLVMMIVAAIMAIHAKDLLSSLIAQGFVGYGLVICFILLRAPDLAIVQIVVETVTLIIMVSVLHDSTRKEIQVPAGKRDIYTYSLSFVLVGLMLYYFNRAIATLNPFGDHALRMSDFYAREAVELSGSTNLIKGVLWDFRALDTFGEATILFAAAAGVMAILRIKGRKE